MKALGTHAWTVWCYKCGEELTSDEVYGPYLNDGYRLYCRDCAELVTRGVV